MTFRILTIDGGGIRGLIPAIWLAQFEDDLQKKGRSLRNSFDLICGTSTGSILAAAICTGVSMKEVIGLFQEKGPRIFQKKTNFLLSIRNARKPKYTSYSLQKALELHFQNKQMHDAKPDLCITAYDIENRKPIPFRSYDKSTRDVDIWQVCLASSSAPTYFPPAVVNIADSRHIMIDGGVAVNNPSAMALAEAVAAKRARSLSDQLDVSLISLGTGSSTRNLAPKGAFPKGWLDWAGPILDVMFDGSSSISDHICRQILDPDKYVRMQFELIKDFGDDDLDNIDSYNLEALKAAARLYTVNSGSDNYKRALAMMLKNRTNPRPLSPGNLPVPV